MNIKYQFFILIGLIITLSACNLDRVVEIDLPEYESELVVECYLKPGEPYRLLLTESRPFFGQQSTDLPLVNGATVTITHQGNTISLNNFPFFDTTDMGAIDKIYNYGSTEIVPSNFDSDFSLSIIDSSGRQLTSITQIPPPLPMDSSVATLSGDSSLFILSYWTDDISRANFYRRMLHKTSPTGDNLELAFTVDDQVINGQNNQIVTGSPPVFESGDTAVVTLLHINEDYFNYIETVEEAVSNNGNPFGQPGVIISNIEGGIGIFTGMTMDRQFMILE